MIKYVVLVPVVPRYCRKETIDSDTYEERHLSSELFGLVRLSGKGHTTAKTCQEVLLTKCFLIFRLNTALEAF